MKTMTAIELIADTLRTGIVECGDFNCYDCPFGADREIHLCHSWNDEDARREGLKQMLFDAVDEAREEEQMTERWKPEFGCVYWVVTSKGDFTSCSTWHADWFDTYQFNFGNCFRTQEEAKAAAEKVKALLLSLHEPARITPKTGQIWRNKISSQNYRVLFTSDWGTAEPYVTIGRIVKHLFDEPEEVQVEGQLFLMDFELVQEPEEEYLHKNPENLGTSSEPSQKVGTCQKTPISESLQQEDCKKRGFLQPSHTTPEHYKLAPEPIDVIKGWDLGFCLGNVIKYIARAGRKAGESRDSDLHKAMEYLRMELEDE